MSSDMRVEKGQINHNMGSGAGKGLFFLSIPFYLVVVVGFWYLFQALGVQTSWKAYGMGALGWLVALVLRTPIGLLVRKNPLGWGRTVMTSASGVCEEGVRVVLLVLTAMTFSWSASVGQGWAAVEVVYAIINSAALLSLKNKTDEKAMQAKQVIQELQGEILNANPFWGVMERLFASAYHIGATLVIAANPWLAIVMVPVHSGLNLIYLRLLKKSMLSAEMWIAFAGAITFVVGLALMGRI